MERDREIVKLINVLRRIARAASYATFYKTDPEAARFCVSQYNKVLARLAELEPAIVPLFTSLPQEASPEVTRVATIELAAFFEDESEGEGPRHRARHCGGRRAWVGWASVSGRC